MSHFFVNKVVKFWSTIPNCLDPRGCRILFTEELLAVISSLKVKVKKVKCTLVQALRLCTGRTAHRGSRGIALPFHDHCNRRGWVVSVAPRAVFTPGKDSVPILQEGRSGQVQKNLAPTGIRSPDNPARSQSLYRLRYPVHQFLALVKHYSGDKIMKDETGDAQKCELKNLLNKYVTLRSTAEIENFVS